MHNMWTAEKGLLICGLRANHRYAILGGGREGSGREGYSSFAENIIFNFFIF